MSQNTAGFNLNYIAFLNEIAQTIAAPNPNVITINSISQNGLSNSKLQSTNQVTVEGNISILNTEGDNPSLMYVNLQHLFNQYNTVGGMEVVSSQLQAIGGTVYSFTINYGLILGICIPVGIIGKNILYF